MAAYAQVHRPLADQQAKKSEEPQIADATAAILLARLMTRPIPELRAMGGITLEDFTQSVAYREIFGLGEDQGRDNGLQQGRQAGELEMALRQLRRRCGVLTPEQETQIRVLPLPRLEALAESLLDFQGPDDLTDWLAQPTPPASEGEPV